MRKINITMYRWAGKKFGIKIKSDCEECDINHAVLQDMCDKEFKDKGVVIEEKPWLTNMWEALRYKGWHAPVVVVNGKLFSQGTFIDRQKLAALIEELHNKSCIE